MSGGEVIIAGPVSFDADSIEVGALSYTRGTVVVQAGVATQTTAYSRGYLDQLPGSLVIVVLLTLIFTKYRF